MRAPEMSYSPAYHQAQDSHSSVPHSIFVPRPHRPLEYPEQAHPAPLRRSDERKPACDISPRSSAPRRSHAYSPEAPRRHSEVDDGLPVSRILVSSSGATHKGERSPRNWVDQPSLMSAEQVSTPRAYKRRVSEEESADGGQDALLMLFRLSIPVPIFSLCACLYTCGALLFAILSSPLRLCSISPYLSNTPFKDQLCDLLSPCLHTHERLVCMRPALSDRSASTQWIRSETNSDQPYILADSSRCYSIGASIAVLLISPLLSIVILLFAWTAAFFWVFTMVMGNPDGTERKDDGRAAVLGVCKWWRTWLGKARK